MTTATRGTVLAGRYRLEERLQSNADGALWRAVDATLDRRVAIRVMPPAHPFAADVADAARRAALIDDPRLVRVLDVGSDGDVGFVVSEDVDGDSLAALVERSPLAPPVVRRIIGEVAEGLDAAAARGLHHLCLTPRSVIVCRDGSVKIGGTAVEAAAAGLEPAHAATASRDDTVALVGLLYSGLTGRWPLGNAGFPPAPRGEGGAPVPPADLVRGIPNDLDTLCVVSLSSDDGPRSPAELVQELAPWPSAEEAPLRAAPRRLPTDAPPPPLDADSPLKLRSRPTSKRSTGSKPAHPATPQATKPGGPPPDPTARPSERPAAGPGAGPAVEAGSGPPGTADSPGLTPRRSATMFPTSVAVTGSLPIPNEPVTEGPRRMDSLFTPAKDRAAPTGSPGSSGPTKPVRTTEQAAEPPAGRPATAPAGETVFGPPAANNAGDRASEPLIPWGQAWAKDATPASGLEANSPFPILIPAETPPRNQSRLVIFSITLVLVLGLVVAAFSLRDLGSKGNVQPAETGSPSTIGALPPTTAAPTAAATTQPEQTTASPSPSASVPVRISSIRAIDPQGDGDEDTARTPLAVDGNDATFWKSQTYGSSSFGGLKKGVGLSIKLKRSATLTSATIDAHGYGGVVEVRTANGPDVSSSKLVGRGTIENGTVTVTATGARPARYVILWFTKLSSVNGNYRLEVSEVRLK